MNSPPEAISRFVALDVHKESVVVAALDATQRVLLPPRRIPRAKFATWAAAHLAPTDAVVLEATTDAWQWHDELRPLVASVTVAHPLLVKLIADARVKTDARDALNLARLLAAGLIPAVWVPPVAVRELRGLLSTASGWSASGPRRATGYTRCCTGTTSCRRRPRRSPRRSAPGGRAWRCRRPSGSARGKTWRCWTVWTG